MKKPLDPSLALAVADVIREQLTFVRTEFAEERKVLEGTISELNAKLSAMPGALAQELADLTHRIGTLESCEPPKGLTLEDVAPLVTQAFEAYPKPKDGDPGKDADPLSIDDIQPVVDLAVKEAVAALPPPKDGTSVTLGDIWPHVSAHLDKAVESLPKPKDGDDAEPVDVERLTLDVLSRIPPPDLGPLTEKIAALETRPTTEQVVELVQAGLICSPVVARFDEIDKRLDELPPPPDLASLTEKIAALETHANVDHINLDNVHERVMALEAKPPPEKGKDADPVDLEALAQDVLARIPPPKDGKSVTVEEIGDFLIAEHAKWAKTFEPEAMNAIQKMVDQIPKPKDGEDAEPVDVERLALDVLSRIPTPEPGKDAEPVDLEALATDVLTRIPVPKDGDSVTVEDIAPLIAAEVAKAVAAIPPPEKGKDADPVDVEALAADVLSRIPVPKDGKSVTVEEVADFLIGEHAKWAETFEPEALAAIHKLVDEIPRPKDGDPGKSVTIEDVQHFLEASYAKWALEAERRVIDLAQRAIDRMPAPKDGTNGIGFDDLTISRDGRKIRHDYMRNGEVVKSFEFKTDELRYQDVYRAGESYDVGDVVSWSGSIWIAIADNKSKPGNGNPDWKLSVKEGRKGKSAYDIARDNGFIGSEVEWLASLKGKEGDPGPRGRDLTQLHFDGRKTP